MQILYVYLIFGWIILTNFHFKSSFTAAVIYLTVLLYAQSKFSPLSGEEFLTENIPMLINTLVALIIVAAVKGQYVLMKQNQLELEYGHQ